MEIKCPYCEKIVDLKIEAISLKKINYLEKDNEIQKQIKQSVKEPKGDSQ